MIDATNDKINIDFHQFNVNFFNSEYGICIYMIFTFIILFIWLMCFSANPISAFISFSVIPFVFFLMGSAYFKSNNDNHHLKIHKILIYIIIVTILLLILITTFSVAIKVNVQNIIIMIIAINMLTSYCLYFNSLGKDNVIDFIINVCTKVKNLIVKF